MSLKLFLLLSFLFFSFPLQAQEPLAMKGMVERHNFWRNEFSLPPVKWSVAIEANAKKWADILQKKGCILEHSTDNYGENIFWASGSSIIPAYVVDKWAGEKANYNFDSNTCKQGKVCGHYTQIIWETTTEIGCAMATCGNEEVWVCQYDPPGNYIGRRPFKK